MTQTFMQGGVPYAKFPNPGDKVTGVIEDVYEQQQREFGTNELLTWEDGQPKMMTVAVLDTGVRDNDLDDGLRKLPIKGKNLSAAIRNAVRKSGARGLAYGGILTVIYERDETVSGGIPPKVYSATYEPPPPGLTDDRFGKQLPTEPDDDQPPF